MRFEAEATGLRFEPRAKIERPLSVPEYYHASVGSSGRTLEPPRMGIMVLEGSGPDLEPEAWREALDKVSREHPGSRLRLAGDRWRARWVNDGQPPRFRFVERTDWDVLSQAGCDFIDAVPISLERGETMELVLVNESPRGRLVILRFAHAIMDGGGSLHFLRDIFRALRGEPLVPSNAAFSDTDLMRRLGPRNSASRHVRTHWLTGLPRGEEMGDQWRRIFLDTRGRNILARIAGIMAEYSHRDSGKPALIAVPVDLRRRLPEMVSVANFSNMLVVRLEKGDGEDVFRHRLRKLLDERADLFFPRVLSLAKLFSLARMDLMLSRTLGNYRRKRPMETAVISNLGRMDSRDFSCDRFVMSRIFAMPLAGSVFSVLVGVDDRVELVLGMPKVLSSNGRFDDFVAFLKQRIKETETC